MHPFLTLEYWFNVRAIPFTPIVERALIVAFVVWTFVGIGAYLFQLKRGFSKPAKRALRKFASLLTWSGIVGLVLWVFTYQRVPVFSMRFLYLLWIGWVVIGFYSIYKYLWVEVPAKRKLHEERLEREKWLPKKKK